MLIRRLTQHRECRMLYLADYDEVLTFSKCPITAPTGAVVER